MKIARGRIIRFLAIGVAAVVLLGYAFDFIFVTKPIEFVARPFLSIGTKVGSWISDIPRPFTSKQNLLSEIDTLNEENTRLQKENSLLHSLQEEERARQKINTFLTEISARGIDANVIGKSSTGQQILLINKGKDHGIDVGYPVITNEGIIIGTIQSTSSLTSHVLLITDSTQRIGAKIQNEKSSPGILRGEFGLSLVIGLIPQDDVVTNGQLVVTSAIDPLIPPNLLIGSITRSTKNESSVFQEAQVTSPLQLERVEYVSVIKPYDV